jgi:hypothetical protein
MAADHGRALLGFRVLFDLLGRGFVSCGIGGLILPGGGALVLGHGNVFHFENLKPTPDHRLRFRSKRRMDGGRRHAEGRPRPADQGVLATGLKHPRSVYVLPNGAVPAVESIAPR